ncbi:CotY/CotZ family spore coat protein [Neobacillus sp. PS3-12]|uniref:CotY/CotZ family spore coat protein n=1 Tax=Neobacillus sp. PS3-12 TaxID=3070677 RepID=UPI0027DF35CB|nr:CotY/CotZ family spore coat protein [Neobacillus sp. PS3-12]WML53363.1 CotY/CotZ family spore coat protein [Neobacillus sp. PS3-12]
MSPEFWHLDKKECHYGQRECHHHKKDYCHDKKECNCHHHNNCLKNTLEKILNEQRKVRKKECDIPSNGCFEHLGRTSTNTIPFILYSNTEPFKVEGVTKCFDCDTNKEKFVCFKSFIFRIIDLEGDCAFLELLKFKNHHKSTSNCDDHVCSPCCQVHCEDVDDLIATGVCIQVELSCFCAIQCLPAVCM